MRGGQGRWDIKIFYDLSGSFISSAAGFPIKIESDQPAEYSKNNIEGGIQNGNGNQQTGIFASVGGMKINTDAQVLDANKHPIPHLYAVGNDAGGLYGDAYDVSICEGSCQGFAVFSGKVAAEHIAANS